LLIGALGLGLIWFFWQNPKELLDLFLGNFLIRISLIYIGWMALTACFSTLPIVSWKYWVVDTAHWWVFAVGISRWPDLWRRALPWFVFSVAGVSIYTLVHHGFYHFRTDQALLAPMPFFPDHTMWAAVLSMVLFLSEMVFAGVRKAFPPKLVAVLLLLALVFSTCRAAWLSVSLAGMVWGFYFLGKKGRLVLVGLLFASGLFFGVAMVHSFGQDVSGQERLNRWNCAIRMSKEKPCLGFGPGTYQFQYIDFQRLDELTRISLLAPAGARGPDTYGRGGGAHSEYLRILAETGWPGLLLWLTLVVSAIVAGSVSATLVAGKPKTNRLPSPSIYLLLALLTFFTHSAVNDFLHDGRIAALFWGCLAMIFAAKKEDGALFGFSG
jgi:O-antigen ligase